MLSLLPPKQEYIRTLLLESRPFNYSELGATAAQPPKSYNIDRNRVLLGQGASVFESARGALREWKMFEVGWVQLCFPTTPIEVGAKIAVLAYTYGLWSLNICQIVYTVDEENCFGFAYGTSAHHIEQGEARFSIVWDRTDDSIYYDMLAFSRPKHWLTRLGYPMSRFMQKRFARDSKAVMLRATIPQ